MKTPAVLIDMAIVGNNIMRTQQDQLDIKHRPHIKTHKIPALGEMQIEAGACDITR